MCFYQLNLRCILFPRRYRWGLVYICGDAFCVLPGMEGGLVVICWVTFLSSSEFCILHGMVGFIQHMLGCIFSPWCHRRGLHIEMIIVSSVESEGFGQHMLRVHFVSSLECSWFGEHNLRYISCPCWHVGYLVTTSGDTVCVLAGMCWVWSTQVEMHLVFLLA